MRRCASAYGGHDMLLICVRWDMASLYGARRSEERLQERGGRGEANHGQWPQAGRSTGWSGGCMCAAHGASHGWHGGQPTDVGVGRVRTIATSFDSAGAERQQRPVPRAARAGPLLQRSRSTLTTVVWDTRVAVDLDVARPTMAPTGQRPVLLAAREGDSLRCVTVTRGCPSPPTPGRGLALSSFS